MAKFKRKKSEIVDAVQFIPPNQIPDGIINVYNNGFTFSAEYWSKEQKHKILPGEWLITESDGKRYSVDPTEFHQSYEEL